MRWRDLDLRSNSDRQTAIGRSLNVKNRFGLSILAALTLGLAPFLPEPHIWKQLVNLFGNTFDQPIDWLDMALHGVPWIWMIVELTLHFRARTKP